MTQTDCLSPKVQLKMNLLRGRETLRRRRILLILVFLFGYANQKLLNAVSERNHKPLKRLGLSLPADSQPVNRHAQDDDKQSDSFLLIHSFSFFSSFMFRPFFYLRLQQPRLFPYFLSLFLCPEALLGEMLTQRIQLELGFPLALWFLCLIIFLISIAILVVR